MNAQFFTFAGMQYLLNNALQSVSLVSVAATTAQGSADISDVDDSVFANLAVGMLIAGPGIPAGTYILSLDGSSGEITLSQAATASGSVTLVVGGTFTQNLPLTIHLLQGQVPLSNGTTFSVMTEANYDGYLPQQAIPPDVINTPPPRTYAVAQFERMTFAPTDYTTQNAITGHAWTYTPPGASGPVLVAVELYPAPIPLQQPGDILTVNPVLSLPFDCTAGVASPGVP